MVLRLTAAVDSIVTNQIQDGHKECVTMADSHTRCVIFVTLEIALIVCDDNNNKLK